MDTELTVVVVDPAEGDGFAAVEGGDGLLSEETCEEVTDDSSDGV